MFVENVLFACVCVCVCVCVRASLYFVLFLLARTHLIVCKESCSFTHRLITTSQPNGRLLDASKQKAAPPTTKKSHFQSVKEENTKPNKQKKKKRKKNTNFNASNFFLLLFILVLELFFLSLSIYLSLSRFVTYF